MKNNVLGLAGFLFLAFQSCKEQIPSGLVLTQTVSVDTSYVLAPETPQNKNVLIEELTGAKCVNCPEGAAILKSLVDQNPNRIVIAGIHSGFLTNPPSTAKFDFRNADADALRLFFNEADPSKPSASFDRVPATSGGSIGKLFIEKGATGGDWLTMLPSRLAQTTPVNIHLTSNYDNATNKVNIGVKLAFTENYTGKLALTLYVLENGRVDIQESKDPNTGAAIEIDDYEFEHVFRKLITPVGGDLVLDSLETKEIGRVLEKYLSFEPNLYNATSNVNGLILDSCVLVGAVHKVGSSKEIIHVEEIKLK